MRFSISGDELAAALSWVARALPARPAVPVLAGLKLEVSGGNLRLSAFDYEQSATASATLESSDEDGTVLVSGKLLSDIARALPKGIVEFALEGPKLRVQCKASKFMLLTMPVDEYPALPVLPGSIGTVDAHDFAGAIKQATVAASKDETLPTLTGVQIEVDPEARTLTLMATDRYRLAIRTLAYEPSGAETLTLLVPAKALDSYAKNLGVDGLVTLGAGAGGGGVFSVEAGVRNGTRLLLDGDFPKVRSLLPTKFAGRAIVSTSTLVEAVRRVGLVAERNTPCRIEFSDGQARLEAGNGVDDQAASEVVAAKVEGENITIAFNFGYLLDGLGAMSSSEVEFGLVSSVKPAILRPWDEAAEGDEPPFTYLLMPVRMSGR